MDKAAAKGQRLSVYFFNGKAGQGKISSWEACRDDAIKRDYFYAKKARVLNELSKSEKVRLDELSSVARDDSQGEEPGSARTDEEELNKNSGFDASPMPSMPERFHASPVPERLPVLVAEPRARSC